MSYKSEAAFQDAVMRYLKKLPETKAYKASNRNNKGVSDVIICQNGRFIAIELKNGDNQPSALQSEFIREIIEAGGIGGVAWTMDDVKAILEQNKFVFLSVDSIQSTSAEKMGKDTTR